MSDKIIDINQINLDTSITPWGAPNSDKGTAHTYFTDYYNEKLLPYKDTSNIVLEIGIWTCASLYVWRNYFSNARIIGVDNFRNSKKPKWKGHDIDKLMLERLEEGKFEHILGDATKAETFVTLENNIDVIIDDGSHKLEEQLKSFEVLFPKLNPGGLYIIEDILDLDNVRHHFENLHPNVKIYDFRNNPNTNKIDNVIIEIKK